MSENSPVLLAVGATGTIGRHVVAVALAHGYRVRALVRDRNRAGDFPADTEIVVGDLTKAETLSSAVAGVEAVVFTHGTYSNPAAAAVVDYGAVRNVLTALGDQKPRIALMTTLGSTDRKGSHDWKRRGERIVRVSGLPYTIVRPAWFDHNKPDELQLLLLQGDKPLVGSPADGVIARRQIAEVLVRSLRSEAALRKTFELHAVRGPEQPDYDTVFGPLDADRPGDLDGAHDKGNMPFEDEPPQIRNELEAVRSKAA
jgi:uncharacterized protein YbjT (DUF2867 family)